MAGEPALQPAGTSAERWGGSPRKRPVCAWWICVPQELQSSCVSVRAGGGKAWCFMEVPVCVGTQGDAARNELSYRSPEPIYR